MSTAERTTAPAGAIEYLTEYEFAELVRVSYPTVRRWRATGTDPPALRIGRSIRYPRSSVLAWLRQRPAA